MLLRWLTAALLLVAAGVLALWWFFRDALLIALLVLRLAPDHDFTLTRVPAAPNYFDASAWAALPWRQDAADAAAPPYEDRQETAAVDVFFVHPTTFHDASGWNQPLPEARTDALTDHNALLGQASVFNGCCRIFAPRYRQATRYAFMDRSDNRDRALAVARRDVRTALEHYLTHWNDGRPFVLAGHSQGSYHLDRLLREWLVDRPELGRLVAAYAIGAFIDAAPYDASTLPICGSAAATGCVVSWNSVGPDVTLFAPASGSICVNPLSWLNDAAAVPASRNSGSLQWPFVRAPKPRRPDRFAPPPLERGVADARCDDGVLRITRIDSKQFGARPLGRDNYHVYDYGLFWDSLRRNVRTRIDAWIDAHPDAVPAS